MGTAAQEKRRAVLEALAPRAPLNLERNYHHFLEDLGQGIPGSGLARALQSLMLEQEEKRKPGLPLSPRPQGEESLRALGLGGWLQVVQGVVQTAWSQRWCEWWWRVWRGSSGVSPGVILERSHPC